MGRVAGQPARGGRTLRGRGVSSRSMARRIAIEFSSAVSGRGRPFGSLLLAMGTVRPQDSTQQLPGIEI
jgi:hypothetical protein